jgi:hypothetical protein
MGEPVFMKPGVYTCVIAPEPISIAYFTNPSNQPVCLYVYPLMVARQWISNEYAAIEELLDASFSMQSVLYQRKVGDSFFPELLVNFLRKTYAKVVTAKW